MHFYFRENWLCTTKSSRLPENTIKSLKLRKIRAKVTRFSENYHSVRITRESSNLPLYTRNELTSMPLLSSGIFLLHPDTQYTEIGLGGRVSQGDGGLPFRACLPGLLPRTAARRQLLPRRLLKIRPWLASACCPIPTRTELLKIWMPP
jgi:hypothetical protein